MRLLLFWHAKPGVIIVKILRDDGLKDAVLFATAGAIGLAGSIFLARLAFNKVFDWATDLVMTEDYDDNLMEFYSAGSRMGAQNIVETNMRAEKGRALQRPLGSPRKFQGFNHLMFNTAQLHRLVTPPDTRIDLKVTIGPQAKRPLHIRSEERRVG